MSAAPRIIVEEGRNVLTGAATLEHVGALENSLAALPAAKPLDLSRLERLDTSGALLLARRAGGTVGASAAHQALLDTVAAALPRPETAPRARRSWRQPVERIGALIAGGMAGLAGLTTTLGAFLAGLGRAALRPAEFRLTALTAHAHEVGLRAVPIVALMGFLIGIVLAFQGAAQLRQFGAEIFVIDLIAVSVTRELGILLTAIIVAGRTASAYTAAIGSMKMREEIDAMRTLGIDPVQALIVPRVLALLLMLPILGLIANLSGLVGGALMSWSQLGISPAMFLSRLTENTDLSHILVGLVKAPVFALIIGIVGCHAGMQVRGNAESLGMMTSRAVVLAIFAVIVADAVFSVFFAEIGL